MNRIKSLLIILSLISLVAVFTGVFIVNKVSKEKSEISAKEKYKMQENLKSEEKVKNTSFEPVKFEENKEQKMDNSLQITKEFFEREIYPMMQNVEGNNSIVFQDMNNESNKISYNNSPQKSASVIKLFIMAEVFNQISNQNLSIQDVINDVNLMIQKSDNDSTNRLIDKVGMDNVNNFIQNLGATNTKLSRKMLDTKSIEKGIDNYTSVEDVALLLKKMYNNELVTQYDKNMLEILLMQTKREKIPAKIQGDINTQIYNKTGEYEKYKIENDVAIIKTSKGAYVLCILCEGGQRDKQVSLIADVSKKIYDFYNSQLYKDGLGKSDMNKEVPMQEKQALFNPSDKTVCIDAGHQLRGNYNKETLAPSSKKTKAKVTSGTQGVVTRINEYEFNLDLAKMLKKDLEKKGYKVVMVREVHEVDISNQERAKIANESKSDIYIRIHANGSEDSSVNGIETYYASPNNPDVGKYSKDSGLLSTLMLDKMCEKTGAKKRGAIQRDDLTGTNFANMPTTLIEAGYMSNPQEDRKLADAGYRQKIVDALVESIDEYFTLKSKQ